VGKGWRVDQGVEGNGEAARCSGDSIVTVNRQAEGQKPTLAELRQSGEIEEHADVIIFLHRDRGSNETDMIVAKHRNGATGSWPLYFDEQMVRFRNGTRQGETK
jgi:replicative DNA helicase